jgi:cobalt-zinc-cadmium efflux system outer membrane protein
MKMKILFTKQWLAVSTLTLIISGTALFVAVSSAQAMDTGEAQTTADSLSASYERSEHLPIDIDSTSGLDDYLLYSLRQSPALRRAFYRWKATLEKSNYAGALPDPTFSFGYFIENVETRVGPQNQRLSLKQPFPWFGTLGAKKEMATQGANAAFQKYQSEKLKLFYQVKAAWYDLYYLGRDIALTRDNLQLLLFWESVVRAKYKVALKQHPDLIKAQVEAGKLEDRLLTLEDKIEPTVARLKAVLNLPDSVSLSVPVEIRVTETAINSDSIIAWTLAGNPDLAARLHLIEKERAGVRLARKASLPNFTVGVDYIETGSALNPILAESGKDAWVVGVGLNLPIWFGKNRAKKREAEAQLRMVQYDYAEARNQLIAFTKMVVFEYANAMRKASLYRDGLVPKAEQALNAGYTAYQAGEADFLDLLDAQRQLLAFQLQLEKARTDLAIRRAEIEMIINREIDN